MERFEITTPQERRRVAPLFAGMEDSLIETFVQGIAGQGFCDDLAFPRCAVIAVRDEFLFFGGDSKGEGAGEIAAFLPERGHSFLASGCEPGWIDLLVKAHPGKAKTITRYAFERNPDNFDKEQLRAMARKIPEGYEVLGMDEEMYELAMAQGWSRDFVSFFNNAEDFVERGIGFCALHGEELVSAASSFTIYEGGIEVQIETDEKHRRKGLAKACAATLILACLAQGRFPCWDAANEASMELALDLGYCLLSEYTAVEISR